MPAPTSKIFEAYAQLAEEQGLISKDAGYEEARRGSDDISTIELLYGKRKDGEDLLDKAHPKTVVIAPAHDKFNGVVENLKERQQVFYEVALKNRPHGSTPRKNYLQAEQELLDSLISVGYSLDSKDEDALMKLADSCAERLIKEALAPGVIVGGIAAALGLMAWINNTSYSNQGVYNNAEAAIRELTDLKNKLPLGIVDTIVSNLKLLQEYANDFYNLTPVNLEGGIQKVVESAQTQKDKIETAEKYQRACKVMAQYIPRYISTLKGLKPKEDYKYDWWQKIQDAFSALVPDDMADAIHALEGLQKAVAEVAQEGDAFLERAKQYEPTLLEAMNDLPSQSPAEGAISDIVTKELGF